MSRLNAAAVLWTSPFVVIGTLVIFGGIAGCAVGELLEHRRVRQVHRRDRRKAGAH